jgi:predicted metal-dependent hydrolase
MLFENQNQIFLENNLTVKIEKKPRKNLSIIIKRDGQIIVRSPLKFSNKKIQELLISKQAWISKTLQKIQQKQREENENQSNLKQNQEIYIFGEKYKIQVFFENESQNQKEIFKNKYLQNLSFVLEKNINQLDSFWLENFCLDQSSKTFFVSSQVFRFRDRDKKIKTFLEKLLEIYLNQNIPRFLQKLKLTTSFSLKIKDYKSKWGSCHYFTKILKIPFLKQKSISKVGLCFNFSLVFFDYKIIDYLIAHEVCHILEANHSHKFWSLVAKIYPDYKEAKKFLREKSHFQIYKFE